MVSFAACAVKLASGAPGRPGTADGAPRAAAPQRSEPQAPFQHPPCTRPPGPGAETGVRGSHLRRTAAIVFVDIRICDRTCSAIQQSGFVDVCVVVKDTNLCALDESPSVDRRVCRKV